MSAADLHVACAREVPVGGLMAFHAERLFPALSAQWVLCLLTDRAAIRLTEVAPPALRYTLDRDGVLGLSFPATVTAVRLTVAAPEAGTSQWHFWADDEA